MGNPKQKWTSEEEEALRAGVAKHGPGKWKNIQKDPEFNHLLYSRSNIDLKDKWRNLSVASGLLPREKIKVLKLPNPATPLLITQSSASVAASSLDSSMAIVAVDSSKPVPEANNTSKYNELIYEAISTLKDPSGSDCSTIASFIEQRQQVPPNFRRLISSRIRRLVQQEKLDKAENRYKIKGGAPLDAKGPAIMKKKDPLPQKDPQSQPQPQPQPQPQSQSQPHPHPHPHPHPQPQPQQQPKPPVLGIGYLGETVEEAAVAAAYKIAEAENKSFVAAEAVKEAERIAAIAEEMDALLQFAIECYEKTEHGDIVLNF